MMLNDCLQLLYVIFLIYYRKWHIVKDKDRKSSAAIPNANPGMPVGRLEPMSDASPHCILYRNQCLKPCDKLRLLVKPSHYKNGARLKVQRIANDTYF